MKYLVLLLVVLAVLWLLRSKRPAAPPPRGGPGRLPAVEDMVSCAHCGLHLPRGEALPGRGGLFCCEAHRAAHEKLNAPR